jgi:hypothetical protein
MKCSKIASAAMKVLTAVSAVGCEGAACQTEAVSAVAVVVEAGAGNNNLGRFAP